MTVVQIWKEHVISRAHIKLHLCSGDLQINEWHGVVIAIVAVTRISFAHTWIWLFWVVTGQFIASVCLDHKGLGEVLIEELWEQSTSLPGVNGQNLLLKLFFHRWHIVLNLKH